MEPTDAGTISIATKRRQALSVKPFPSDVLIIVFISWPLTSVCKLGRFYRNRFKCKCAGEIELIFLNCMRHQSIFPLAKHLTKLKIECKVFISS